MKRCAFITLILAIAIGGCIPKRLLFWSPDGQRVVVVTPDGVRLSGADGKLGDVFAKNVELAAWFPDSRRFVVARTDAASDWKEVETSLGPERHAKVVALADRLRAEAIAYQGDWDNFKPTFAAELSDGEMIALLFYVRDHRNEGLAEKLGSRWDDLKKLTVPIHQIQLYEMNGGVAAAGRVLTRTVNGVVEMRVSPKGGAIACVQSISGGEHPIFRLTVISAGGGALRDVAQPVSMFPDWKPDGQDLVYQTAPAKTGGVDTLQLGTIAQRRVCAESGELLKEFSKPSEDIGVLFWPFNKLRCMRDGRILFASMEVTLPAPKDDMPERASLFFLDPSRGRTVARLLSREAEAKLPNGLSLGCFQLSPDQKRLMVCATDKTNVVVVTLATGEVWEVVNDKDADIKAVPVWRTSEELTVPVPPKSKWGSPGRYEYVLWSSPEKARCLSCSWPDIFEEPKPVASSPAPNPASDSPNH